jgi:ribosomal protein S27AE
LGKLITVNPPIDLTKEEEKHLDYIRNVLGKGHIRNYVVRQLHICPKCGSHGWQGGSNVSGLKCSHCGYDVTLAEWANLDHQEYWEEI